MKKFLALLFATVTAATFCFAAGGCSSSDSADDPIKIVQNQYGNEEFTISFSTNGLDTPVDSITYTSYKMPALPTPTRVGYVFSGWYMDSSLTVPYVDNILYLYMTDVTLYAKWTKEELSVSGTYDIEFSAEIMEETVDKNDKCDEYGGYKDFTECIIADETYIEYTGDETLLKIQYDCGVVENMNYVSTPVFSLSDSGLNNGTAYIDTSKTISSYSSAIKTVFINIDDWDMEDSLYFNVTTTNWDNTEIADSQRYLTTAMYTVEFNITRFIGFSKPYADVSVGLEDGWYLAKSYYRKQNNAVSMSSSFNPVYSYVYAESGRYTLIKEFIPYLGMIGASNNILSPETANYFYRLVSHAPMQLYYGMSSAGLSGEVDSDYYPETYNGTSYGVYAAEYHADTGKYYAIYDFGNDLTQEMMVMGATTGFMEATSSMGYSNQILSIDTSSLIKLSADSVAKDYVPLTESDETAYEYTDVMQYYPGNFDDLNDKGLMYDAVQEYGMSTHMINFFFGAESLSTPYTQRTMYSSRITVSPTAETNATSVADSRYSIAHFTVTAKVYGYSEDSGLNLYADSMTVQSLDDGGMRENIQIKTGKSISAGEAVNLADIYAEKVNPETDFKNVSYTAKTLAGTSVSLPQNFTYGTQYKNIVVEFTYKSGGQTSKTQVYLTDVEEAVTTVYNYDSEKTYRIGDQVTIPDIKYTWCGATDSFINNYFDDDDYPTGINIVRFMVFSVSNGAYSGDYKAYVMGNSYNSFSIATEEVCLLYELQNEYGERCYKTLRFYASQSAQCTVTSSLGEMLYKEDIVYDSDGERKTLSEIFAYYCSDDLSAVKERLSAQYTIDLDGQEQKSLELVSYTVYTDKYTQESVPVSDYSELYAAAEVFASDAGYMYFAVEYSDGEDTVIIGILYNVNFSGKRSALLISYDTYFTNKTYTVTQPYIYGLDGTLIGETYSVSIYKYNGDALTNNIVTAKSVSLTNSSGVSKLLFYDTGKYQLQIKYSIDGAASGYSAFTFYQDIEVMSDKGDVTVTYVTDEDHPFIDGSLQKIVTYSLAGDITTLNQEDNFISDDVLFGWVDSPEKLASSAVLSGGDIENFTKYNSKNITKYAVWDAGVQITTLVNGVEKTYDTIYYRATENNYSTENSASKGAYTIDLSVFDTEPPTGGVAGSYEFLGWTGGFLGTAVKTGRVTISRNDVSDKDYLTITPVYKHYITVSYKVNEDYSLSVISSSKVLDGEKISNSSSKMRVKGKTGYTFKGWALKTGDSVDAENLITLSSQAISAEWADENYVVTLVAVFEDSEGNLVW